MTVAHRFDLRSSPKRDYDQWEFVLPDLRELGSLPVGFGNAVEAFDLTRLVATLQHGANLAMVKRYLGYYDSATVGQNINNLVHGFPAMFFVVATNDEAMIRVWNSHGGDVNATHEASGLPLLAFAIMQQETMERDTTQLAATLLSLGARPQVIPDRLYTPYDRDLKNGGSHEDEMDLSCNNSWKWCTPAAMKRLERTMHLTHRYNLHTAAKMKQPTAIQRQVVKLRGAEHLFSIPYFLIGQTVAVNLLTKSLLSHLTLPSKEPLVLVFAGPSGHDKTELARRLGRLLSLDLEVVNCTTASHATDLFGPRAPYYGSEKGSLLNNFLVRNHQRLSSFWTSLI